MAQERMTAEARTAQLAEAGLKIARKLGIRKVTRAAVARVRGQALDAVTSIRCRSNRPHVRPVSFCACANVSNGSILGTNVNK